MEGLVAVLSSLVQGGEERSRGVSELVRDRREALQVARLHRANVEEKPQGRA